MKKIFKKEFAIGLSVIVAILILIFGIDFLKGINLFKPANFYVAQFENVGGLIVSAPVNIDGYKVGQVREIRFNYEHPGTIDVELALDKELRIPAGTKAILTPTLLSGPAIELKLARQGEILPVGSVIPSATASDLMGSIGSDVMPAVTSILPKVDTLVSNVNRLVSDPALLASIRNLELITGNLTATSSGLNVTVNGQLPVVMRNAVGITHKVDTMALNLAMLSSQLKALPLNSTFQNIDQVVANLSRFSDQLNNRNSTLGMLTTDPELYNRLNRVSADIDSLIVDIKKNPKRYISIKLL